MFFLWVKGWFLPSLYVLCMYISMKKMEKKISFVLKFVFFLSIFNYYAC